MSALCSGLRERIRATLFVGALWACFAFAGGPAQAVEFKLQALPSNRPDDAVAWHDVNGDGRNDFVRQRERELTVHFLAEDHRLSPTPDWTVQLTPPWDLWQFADVRPDVPGEELLALSPQGVGWTSYERRTTSTAGMERLVTVQLPLQWDERRARPGDYAVGLRPDGAPDLLLPTRSSLQVYRRQADAAKWEVAEDLPAPLQPRPRFASRSSTPFLVGSGPFAMPVRYEPLRPAAAGPLTWRVFHFRTHWSAWGGWLIDWNGDGRLDWVESKTGRREQLVIYLQTPDGRFDRDKPIVPPTVRPENDETDAEAGRLFPDQEEGFLTAPGEMRLEELADVNGDGRLDFVRISTLENWAVPKSRVAVFLQTEENTYPEEPDSQVRLGAIVPIDRLPLSDVDGDGDLDLLLLRIDLHVGSVDSHLKAFMRKGIETYLGAYLWEERSGHAKRPEWEKEIVIGHDLFEFSREPQTLMQFDRDLTGDGRPDLVLRLTRKSVGVFALTDPDEGFAPSATATLDLPFPIDSIECDDYDGDGRQDVLVQGRDRQNDDRLRRAVFFGQRGSSD